MCGSGRDDTARTAGHRHRLSHTIDLHLDGQRKRAVVRHLPPEGKTGIVALFDQVGQCGLSEIDIEEPAEIPAGLLRNRSFEIPGRREAWRDVARSGIGAP